METRSKTRVRATSSPPREGTDGGPQPSSDEFVGLPPSAIGFARDGKVSSRSTSVEAGLRSACRPSICSESADVEQGPAQGAIFAENREFADVLHSDVADTVCITATDDRRQISTLVPFAELDARGVALHSDVLRRASSVASPRGLSISGADHDIRPILHVSPDQLAPGPFAWLWLALLVSKTDIRR